MTIRSILAAALAAGLSLSMHAAGAANAPARVILVGDSTMATESGYGDALCARFVPEVKCINRARGGRSTKSFRAEGLWDNVQALLREPGFDRTYVLIQFGHNDQPGKPGRSTDLVTEFGPNMTRYAQEVKAAGGVPVLVTPLTRRSFRDKVLQNDLRAWAEATLDVARAQGVPALDLNAESYTAVQMMGEQEADTFANKREFDGTHLGSKGATFFSRMVQHELSIAVPALAPYFKGEQ